MDPTDVDPTESESQTQATLSGQGAIAQDHGMAVAATGPDSIAVGSAGRDVNITVSKYYAPALPQPVPVPLQRPPRADHFTGREAELVRLLADLQPGRVVTLCGSGGIGKSALAAEAVWSLAPGNEPPEQFPDGIIFHSFYTQPQALQALEAIVHAWGEEPKPTLPDAARRVLARRCALLLLDGAEEADDLPAVLDVRGNCGVLITSRARGDAPTVQYRHDLARLPLDQALALLGQHAGFSPDPEVGEEICRQVDGLPLAVRLVGRYLAASGESPQGYLAWLQEEPLAALNRPQARHRDESVIRLLARSVAQVGARGEQVLGIVGLLALAPCDRPVLAAALDRPESELRPALAGLVNYGLLAARQERYEPSHALIHTYARRELPPPAAAIPRLAAYYTALAQTETARGLPGYERLAPERAHLLRVLAVCRDGEAWEAVRRLVWAIDGYLDLQGHGSERVTALQAGLHAARQLGHRRDKGAFLGNLGNAYRNLGQVQQAIGHYEQALAIARNMGDRRGEGIWLGNLGNAYHNIGQMQQAIDYHQQALAIARETGDRNGEGGQLGDLGLAYADLGQMQQAINYYQQALAISREIGDRRGKSIWLGNLGNTYAALGEIKEAIKYYEQALVITREIGDRFGEGNHLGNLGLAYADLGQVQQAINYYQQALAISREIGDRRGEGVDLGNLGNAYHNLGQVQQAIHYQQQALAIAREIGDRRGEGNRLSNLGNAYFTLGQVQQAIDCHQQALATAQEIGDLRGQGNHLGNLGNAYFTLGEVQQAIDYYEQALVISRDIGDRRGEGNRLSNLGTVYAKLAQVQTAIEYYHQALAIFQKIGARRLEGISLNNLGLACQAQGNIQPAIECHEQALVIARDLGDQQIEQAALTHLAGLRQK